MIGLRIMLGIVVASGWASTAAAQEPLGTSLNPMRDVDKASLRGFLEQPLFDPTRRLPPPPPAPVYVPPPVVAVPPAPPPVLQLIGVVHGRRDMAFVHRDGNEKTVVLRTGDKLGAWTVTVHPPVGVRLRDGDRVFDYALFAKPGSPPGPVAAAAPPEPQGMEALAARNERLQRREYFQR